VLQADGTAASIPFDAESEFLARNGHPEYAVFQPEETLADLFPQIVRRDPELHSPRLAHRFREALLGWRSPPAGPPAGIFDALLDVETPAALYLIEVTTNLVNWVVAEKINALNNRLFFDDRTAWKTDRQFYNIKDPSSLTPRQRITNFIR
jgi:hypothetical protein